MKGNHNHRLIKVSLPLKAISTQSAREKSIRHGHISTLHIWWARRPLAAMRAAIFASLIPAPDTDEERERLLKPEKPPLPPLPPEPKEDGEEGQIITPLPPPPPPPPAIYQSVTIETPVDWRQ